MLALAAMPSPNQCSTTPPVSPRNAQQPIEPVWRTMAQLGTRLQSLEQTPTAHLLSRMIADLRSLLSRAHSASGQPSCLAANANRASGQKNVLLSGKRLSQKMLTECSTSLAMAFWRRAKGAYRYNCMPLAVVHDC